MIIYLSALPRVWFSLRNSKEAAESVEPGSFLCRISYIIQLGRFTFCEHEKRLKTYNPNPLFGVILFILVFRELLLILKLLLILRLM